MSDRPFPPGERSPLDRSAAPSPSLREMTRALRAEPAPPRDWAALETELFARLDARLDAPLDGRPSRAGSAAASVAPRGPSPSSAPQAARGGRASRRAVARWGLVAFTAVAAAAAAVTLWPSRGPNAARDPSDRHAAGPVAMTSDSARAHDAPDAPAAPLAAGATLVAAGAPLERAVGPHKFTLAAGSRATVIDGRVDHFALDLREGRVRVEVEAHVQGAGQGERDGAGAHGASGAAPTAPDAASDRFVVLASGVRVAVRGTVFSVGYDPERGAGVAVEVERGVVSVGPRAGGETELLRAPSAANFDDTTAARLALAQAAPPPRPPTAPSAAKASDSPKAVLSRGAAESSLRACFRSSYAAQDDDVRVTISTSVTLRVGADGAVSGVHFDPPLAPAFQACASSLFGRRFAPGTADVTFPVNLTF